MQTRSRSFPAREFARLFTIAVALVASGGAAAAGPLATWTEPFSGIEFVELPAGCFDMGAAAPGVVHPSSPESRTPRPDETPKHRVCLDGFWMARHELTRAQWARVMGRPAPGDQPDSWPVTDLTWHMANEFIDRLAARTGTPGFRLPTEAEWEYACFANRHVEAVELIDGGEIGRFQDALAETAWYKYMTVWHRDLNPVGRKRANDWGLFDMLGNAYEWTADVYDPQGYRRHADRNPLIRDGGTSRVVRGGSALSEYWRVRCGARNDTPPDDRFPLLGLRVARSLSK